MWLVLWICMRVGGECHIWNMEMETITMHGCNAWALRYEAAWDDPGWVVKRWRCSMTPVPKDYDGMPVE